MLAVVTTLALVAGCGDTGGNQPATKSVDAALPAPSALLTATPEATPTADPLPVTEPTEKKRVRETQRIAYVTRTVKDSALASGTRKVRTKGVAGVRTLTYEVTLTGGKQTAKKLVSSTVTRAPVTEVVAVGTKTARTCDPNYGGCVPIASDVDCAGGSGNGPAYVQGPVKVIGSDIYDLDRDNDGYGCDD